MTHTPGPWTAIPNRDRVFPVSVVCPDEAELARVVAQHNARLIAAAPELLEALEQVLSEIKNGFPNGVSMGLAEAAIAKAKGE